MYSGEKSARFTLTTSLYYSSLSLLKPSVTVIFTEKKYAYQIKMLIGKLKLWIISLVVLLSFMVLINFLHQILIHRLDLESITVTKTLLCASTVL